MANPTSPQKSQASAPVAVNVSAPAAPAPDSDEVAALKAEIAAMKAAQGSNPFTAGQIDDAIAASLVPEIPGTTVRPLSGPLHPTAKTPIFNGARPTGKAG